MLHPLFPSAIAFLLLWFCEVISLAVGGLQGFALISASIALFGLLSIALWLSLSFEGLFFALKLRFKTYFDMQLIDRFAVLTVLILLGGFQVFSLEKLVIFFHPKFRQITYLGLSIALSTLGINLISLFLFQPIFKLVSLLFLAFNWGFDRLLDLLNRVIPIRLWFLSPFTRSGFFVSLLILGFFGIDFLQSSFEQFHTLDFRPIALMCLWLYVWLLIKAYQFEIQTALMEIKALMMLVPTHLISKFYFLFLARFWILFFFVLSLYGLWVSALINDRLSIAISRDTRIATFVLSGLQWASDQDGDGVSHLFGQKDCQPNQTQIAPNVQEMNQDLNCNGQSFKQNQNPLEVQNQGFDQFKKLLNPTNPNNPITNRPNVILLTIDALRYDLAMKNMPKLKAFADQNISFKNAYGHAPATYWSLPALLTSKMPSTIDMANDQTPQNTELLLTEILSAQQYHTALFANVTVFFVRGLRQGMYVSDYQTSDYTIHGAKPGSEHLRLGMTKYIDDFLAQKIQPKKDRFFLWGHFYDPHDPYFDVPNYPANGEDDLSKYEAILRWTDDQIAIFIDDLKKKGVLDQSILIITADHGEEFLDHQHRHHGKTLYEEMIKIPLILSIPNWQAQPKQDEVLNLPVGHRQVLPTLLDFLQIPYPVGTLYSRQSLYPLLKQPELLQNPNLNPNTFHPMFSVFFEALADQNYRQNLVGLRNQQHKIIYHMNDGTFEYYDLQKDPQEKYNDFEQIDQSSVLKKLKAQLMQYVDFQRHQQWLKKVKK